MDSFDYFLPVCGPGSRVIAIFLDFPQMNDFREKLFIANFSRVFVKTSHGRIFYFAINKSNLKPLTSTHTNIQTHKPTIRKHCTMHTETYPMPHVTMTLVDGSKSY